MIQHSLGRPGQSDLGLAGAAELAAQGALSPFTLGLGTDLVFIPDFASVLATPGSRFTSPGKVFTAREFRRARLRAEQKGDSLDLHLATVWALKEAALKAWLAALSQLGVPPPLSPEQVAWSQIQIINDAAGAPSVNLVENMGLAFAESLGLPSRPSPWRASASHDGDYALAVVALVQTP